MRARRGEAGVLGDPFEPLEERFQFDRLKQRLEIVTERLEAGVIATQPA